MEFALNSQDFDPTCVLVSAWLIVAFALGVWYLTSSRSNHP